MCIALLICKRQGVQQRCFTEVYGRLGDEDFVGGVLCVIGRARASEGIPGGLASSKILHE